jgi:hypothetical protein
MLTLRKYIAPLAFLFVIIFAAGVALTPAVSASEIKLEQCCDQDASPDVPVDGECFDCNCLSCLFGVDLREEQNKSRTTVKKTSSWFLSTMTPSGFIRSIDYPPESA